MSFLSQQSNDRSSCVAHSINASAISIWLVVSVIFFSIGCMTSTLYAYTIQTSHINVHPSLIEAAKSVSTDASSDPYSICHRAAVFHFAPNGAGIGSHINVLTTSMIMASLTGHHIFMDDHQLNYGRYEWYFEPWRSTGISPIRIYDQLDRITEADKLLDAVVWRLPVPAAGSFNIDHHNRSNETVTCTQPHPLSLQRAIWHRHDINKMSIPALWNLSQVDFDGLYTNPLISDLKQRDDVTGSLFMLMRRHYLRNYIQPQSRIGERAREWLDREGLIAQHDHHDGARYIAVHVRRGDKLATIKSKSNSIQSYIRAINRVIADHSDGELNQSWSTIRTHHNDDTRDACNSSWVDYQPHIVLISDDMNVLLDLPLLLPCLRWHIPFAGTIGGHSQAHFDSISFDERYEMTNEFLIELMLLAHADYSIVSFTSNIGRLIATLRGHQNAFIEKRVQSVDSKWKEY